MTTIRLNIAPADELPIWQLLDNCSIGSRSGGETSRRWKRILGDTKKIWILTLNKTELLEFIANGENSRIEFKQDDCRPVVVAKSMSALLNLEGGFILLGIEDDGRISGLVRSAELAEEWAINIAREKVQPPYTPTWTCIEMEDGKRVGVVGLPANSPSKPYKARKQSAWVAFTRVGRTSRECTREEEARLYQAAGLVRYEMISVPNTDPSYLDMDRVENYFTRVLERDAPSRSDVEEWQQLLLNSDLLVSEEEYVRTSVAGLLLFGANPNPRLPQAGITAAAFRHSEKDYDTIDEERIRGPLVSLMSTNGPVIETGVIDRGIDFVKRNMGGIAWLDGARRLRKGALPLDAVREALVNAVAHRDYTLEGTDIEVSLYSDRLEVISPGRLPNGVTVEKMKEGVVRVSRNKLLKEILRDYDYIEHYGMGVRKRIIESMLRHNGTEPDLVEQENRFLVRMWKKPSDGGGA